MWTIMARAYVWLSDRRAEEGQSLAFLSMILVFAIAAGAIAYALTTSGVLETGGSGPTEFEAPNFNPPNPLP